MKHKLPLLGPETVETLVFLRNKLTETEKSKDDAYWERNQLVCALSKLFPACLAKHPEEDKSWDEDWRTIVFIILPTGQASWHIHDLEVSLFEAHLNWELGIVWDGHTTEEKYKRLAACPKNSTYQHNET